MVRVRVILLCLGVLPGQSGWLCRADVVGDLGPQQPTPAGIAYNKAAGALAENRLDLAEEGFLESLHLDPGNAGAYLGLAKVEIQKNRPKAAGEYIEKAVRLAPEDAGHQIIWGHYLFWRRRYGEAETAFKKAIELEPHSAPARVALGTLYLLGMRQTKVAVDLYRSALAIAPNDAGTHFLLSNALSEAGDFDGAEAELKKAAACDPKNASRLQALGDFEAKRGQPDKAVAYYAKALEIDPKFVPARLARGEIFADRGETGKALDEYESALKADPNLATAFTKIGMLEERLSRFPEAEEAYHNAIRLDQRQAVAYNNLAWLAVERSATPDHAGLDQALEWSRKAVSLAPSVATFRDTLAWVYHARHQPEKAFLELKKAETLDPQAPEVWYHLGVVSLEQGRAGYAQYAFHKALQIKANFPDAADARRYLAESERRGRNRATEP